MNLIVDAGNTNIKIGYFKNNKIVKIIRFEKEKISNIKLPSINERISSIYVGSVIPSFNNKIINKLHATYKVTPKLIKNQMFLEHFDLSKFNINEIGTDILGLAIYIKTVYKKACAISFGTATFSIAVDNKKLHGVMIAPSFSFAFDTLNTSTELTRTNEFDAKTNLYSWFDYGFNTPTALAAGANHLAKGFVDSLIEFTSKKYNIKKYCVCGGKTKTLTFLKQKKYTKKIAVLEEPILTGYYFLTKDF
ncbi:MAG: type III pantothenate kinase [Mycoplasmoidaceae bacterium]|nr:type III pantothenate kinase [Mycoplasmoidaceae bacterium]